ncbi:MAG: hypothetical protein WC944_10580 [Candidatus Cloacimonadaceae bacterium]
MPTADNIETIITGVSAGGIATLIFLGVIATVGVLLFVWNVLNFRLKPVEKLEQKMDKMQETLSEMNAKIWSTDSLNNRIDNKISAQLKMHERECRFNPANRSN